MNAGIVRVLHALPAGVNVADNGASEAGDAGALDLFGNGGDGLDLLRGVRGEACLDDVYSHAFELFTDLTLSSRFIVAPGACSPSRMVVSRLRCGP